MAAYGSPALHLLRELMNARKRERKLQAELDFAEASDERELKRIYKGKEKRLRRSRARAQKELHRSNILHLNVVHSYAHRSKLLAYERSIDECNQKLTTLLFKKETDGMEMFKKLNPFRKRVQKLHQRCSKLKKEILKYNDIRVKTGNEFRMVQELTSEGWYAKVTPAEGARAAVRERIRQRRQYLKKKIQEEKKEKIQEEEEEKKKKKIQEEKKKIQEEEEEEN